MQEYTTANDQVKVSEQEFGVVLNGELVATRYDRVDAYDHAALHRREGYEAIVIRLPAQPV